MNNHISIGYIALIVIFLVSGWMGFNGNAEGAFVCGLSFGMLIGLLMQRLLYLKG